MNLDRNRRILVIDDQENIHEDYRKIIGPPHDAGAIQQAAADLFGDSDAKLVECHLSERNHAVARQTT